MKRLILATLVVFAAMPALACETVRVGDIEVEHAWSRATIGADRPGVVYLSIRNTGSTDDALIGVATPISGMPMLHETVVSDGIASMPHTMSMPVPAGQTAALAPGGFHGMLMGLTQALKKGDSFPLTLTFETAGDVTVTVDVLGMGAKEAECPDAQP
ncbi:copper chaperone PCu(A)C [Frigidibacter mobilis]|uniref:Putative lipoprotein n=1 Tax=Frigidibacter mobilis TaxID=1335048 RepID=A0A159Z9I7_9RHOB|nr:copper chaperone PCu(A)C [Frigidibacter mobilis]AMY72256.1 putative lipoprotein [Frigidibacter mobilis]